MNESEIKTDANTEAQKHDAAASRISFGGLSLVEKVVYPFLVVIAVISIAAESLWVQFRIWNTNRQLHKIRLRARRRLRKILKSDVGDPLYEFAALAILPENSKKRI
jgi:cell division protein FtsL